MFHIIANFSANSDGRNQTQNCSFNTSHTGILFTKYQIEISNIQAAQITLKKVQITVTFETVGLWTALVERM